MSTFENREKVAAAVLGAGRPMSIDDLRLVLPEIAEGSLISRAAAQLVREGRLRSLCHGIYGDAASPPVRPDAVIEAIRAAGRRLTNFELAKAVGLSVVQAHELTVGGILGIDFRNCYYVVADEVGRKTTMGRRLRGKSGETMVSKALSFVEERGKPMDYAEIRQATGCTNGIIAYLVRTGAVRRVAWGVCGPRTIAAPVEMALTPVEAWRRLRALGDGPHDKVAVSIQGISKEMLKHLVRGGFVAEVVEGGWRAVA